MFKIRGADGKEYGPVTTEQLHQWVREGRAGAQTQVRPQGAAAWSPLNALPQFAGLFAAPPSMDPGVSGPLPPVVKTLGYGHFIVAAISAVWTLLSVFGLMRYFRNDNFHPGFLFYFGWSVSLLSLPLRVITGIGLLQGREWARRLAIGVALFLALYGLYGQIQTIITFANLHDSSMVMRSPMFLLSHVWGLLHLAFNIATVVFLLRPGVRAAFAKKSSGTV